MKELEAGTIFFRRVWREIYKTEMPKAIEPHIERSFEVLVSGVDFTSPATLGCIDCCCETCEAYMNTGVSSCARDLTSHDESKFFNILTEVLNESDRY